MHRHSTGAALPPAPALPTLYEGRSPFARYQRAERIRALLTALARDTEDEAQEVHLAEAARHVDRVSYALAVECWRAP